MQASLQNNDLMAKSKIHTLQTELDQQNEFYKQVESQHEIEIKRLREEIMYLRT